MTHSPQAEAAAIAKSVTLPLPIIAAAGKGEQWAIEEYGAACVLAGMAVKREADREALAAVLSDHWMESRGMTYGSPDRCSCGAETRPLAGEDDVSVRRARAFAEHLADIASGVIREASPVEVTDQAGDPLPWVSETGYRTSVQAWHPTHGLSTYSPRAALGVVEPKPAPETPDLQEDADLREKARLTLLDRLHEWQDNPDAYQTEGEWAAQTIFEVLAVLHPAQDEAAAEQDFGNLPRILLTHPSDGHPAGETCLECRTPAQPVPDEGGNGS